MVLSLATQICFRAVQRNKYVFERQMGTLNIAMSYNVTRTQAYEALMNGLIYLIGLIVVIMAILSFLGLH
jgi:small-conductance mechanosensitive channel